MTVPEAIQHPDSNNQMLYILCIVIGILAFSGFAALVGYSLGSDYANHSRQSVISTTQPIAAPTPTPTPITTETKLITVSSCIAGGYGILATDGTLYQAVNYAVWAQFEPRNTYSIVITDGKIISVVLVAARYYDGGINYEYRGEYSREKYERSDRYRKDEETERMGNSAYGTYAWGAGNPWK